MAKKKVKLNIGCGVVPVRGFVNIDKMFTREELLKMDGSTMEEDMEYVQVDATKLPFDDNSVDLIETSDMLEHIPYKQVPTVLGEMFRVLKKGGEVKIHTANFDELAKLWIERIVNGNIDFTNASCFSFFDLQEVIYGNQNHGGEFHISLFNPSYLKALLASSNFSDIIITVYPTGGSCIVDMETKKELNEEIGNSKDQTGWVTRTEMILAHAKKK